MHERTKINHQKIRKRPATKKTRPLKIQKRPKFIFRMYQNTVVPIQILQIQVHFFRYFKKKLPLQTIIRRLLNVPLVLGDPSSLCAYKLIQQNRIKQIFWLFFVQLNTIKMWYLGCNVPYMDYINRSCILEVIICSYEVYGVR